MMCDEVGVGTGHATHVQTRKVVLAIKRCRWAKSLGQKIIEQREERVYTDECTDTSTSKLLRANYIQFNL